MSCKDELSSWSVMTALSDGDEDGGATLAFWHFRLTDLPGEKNMKSESSKEKK